MKRRYIIILIILVVSQSCATFSRFDNNHIAKTYYKNAQNVLGIYLPPKYEIKSIELQDMWQDWDYTFVYSIENQDYEKIVSSFTKPGIETKKDGNDLVFSYYDPPGRLYEKWTITVGTDFVRINFVHF
jgi:hypothetical protein